MNRELPQLLLGIAALGYRGSITEPALSSLVAHAKEHGVEAVLAWIEDDPGLLVLPSWQFWPVSLMSLAGGRQRRHSLSTVTYNFMNKKEHTVASMNKVLLLGNLGRDPELRSTPKGNQVLNFPMATSRRWKDRETDEIHDQADWHRIVVWGRQAEVLAEYLKKGSQVHVEGRLQTRSWTDGDGAKRYTTEIVASRIQMLGRPDDRRAPEPVEEPEAPATPVEPDGGEEIPF